MASFAPSRNFYPTTLENDSVQFCHFHTNQSLEGFAKIDIFLLFAMALYIFRCRKTIHSWDEFKGHDISCAQIFTFYVRFYANGASPPRFFANFCGSRVLVALRILIFGHFSQVSRATRTANCAFLADFEELAVPGDQQPLRFEPFSLRLLSLTD